MSSSFDNLTQACATGDASTFRASLEALPPSTLKISQIHTLFSVAITNNNHEALDQLLTSFPGTPPLEEDLCASIGSGSKELFQTFLLHNPLLINFQTDRHGTPLQIALNFGRRPQYIAFLLDEGAHLNPQDLEDMPHPLACAVAGYKSPRMLALLLDRGSPIAGTGALAVAAYVGKKAHAEYLLAHGAPVGIGDMPPHHPCPLPLHMAIEKGHVEIARLLMNGGARLEERGPDGESVEDMVWAVDMSTEMRKLLTAKK
ncbi:hypothetical protein MMC11_002382 [Xylographa trunciseda]|nr:hypothetical protein [Xylographa trunciseda]